MKLFGSLSNLERTMSFLRERNTVVASNIANLETPGYRPSDLVRTSTDEAGDFQTMMRTHASHLAAAEPVEGGELVTTDDREPGLDGNTVSLEQQMAKLSETRVRFAAASTVTSKRLALLRYAAGDGV